jgi:hypothetical protein
MCRMMQEIELFLVVRHAVNAGDIGMLRCVYYYILPLLYLRSIGTLSIHLSFISLNQDSIITTERCYTTLSSFTCEPAGTSARYSCILYRPLIQ